MPYTHMSKKNSLVFSLRTTQTKRRPSPRCLLLINGITINLVTPTQIKIHLWSRPCFHPLTLNPSSVSWVPTHLFQHRSPSIDPVWITIISYLDCFITVLVPQLVSLQLCIFSILPNCSLFCTWANKIVASLLKSL